MRKSRVLLAGAAVAAAAVTTSAFTAGNTFTGVHNTIVGYGEATVTGANITAIDYNRDDTDESKLGRRRLHDRHGSIDRARRRHHDAQHGLDADGRRQHLHDRHGTPRRRQHHLHPRRAHRPSTTSTSVGLAVGGAVAAERAGRPPAAPPDP